MWQGDDIPPAGRLGVFGQRFDRNGKRLGGEFQVPSMNFRPSVASDANGNFVVVGEDFDGDDDGISGQRYDRNGARIGGVFLVNTYTTDFQTNASVSSDAQGNFVVVWASWGHGGQDGSSSGVFGQRFDD